jgi:hypothetical protein
MAKGDPFPRAPFPRRDKKALQRDVEKLYGEVMDAEAVMALRLVGWEDARVILQSGLAAMVQISRQEADVEMAYKAAGFLIEYANRQMERAGQNHGGEIMEQLKALYAKALPERSDPLVVNVENEKEGA